MSSYGQFCPVAKAMEVLDERWTLLVVRELVLGSRRFNELRRGNPRMSPALLSKRLRSLERAGVVRRGDDRRAHARTPSPRRARSSSRSSMALGAWGVRWIGELGEPRPRPAPADVGHAPHRAGRRSGRGPARSSRSASTTCRAASSHWWMVVTDGDVDVCDFDPGYDVAATVHTGLRTLTEIWRGDLSWERATRSGAMRIEGPTAVRRALPTWIGQGSFAEVPRTA